MLRCVKLAFDRSAGKIVRSAFWRKDRINLRADMKIRIKVAVCADGKIPHYVIRYICCTADFVLENGIRRISSVTDTQWSIILPELIQKTKEGDIQYITIENASYSWDTPQNMFVFSESGALENCTNGNEPILTAIPTSDLIGVTVEKVHNQLGNSSIYVARRHDFPTYVTQDAKLVLFITGDDVVERILVFDLMDDTCKLIQTIS